MTNTAPAAKTTDAKPCECSKYEAIEGTISDEQIENGDYESWGTGCSETTRNTFAPGHDAKLKSFLIKHEVRGDEIRRDEGGMAFTADALTHARRYEFAHMVAAGIANAEAKAQAKAAKKAERDAKKTRKALETGEVAVVTGPGTVKAKVGRWEYEGVLADNGHLFTYVNGKDETVSTRKFTLI